MKYKIPVSLFFNGYAIVDNATDEQHAIELVLSNASASLNNVYFNDCENIIDWNIDLKSNAEYDYNQKTIPLYDNIQDIIEQYFAVSEDGNGYNLQEYTPTGEDWNIYIDRLEDIIDYADYFDPEEEFEFWVKADIRGKPSISELWQDQLWKQDYLNKLREEISSFNRLDNKE
jgi:hypothetical protein